MRRVFCTLILSVAATIVGAGPAHADEFRKPSVYGSHAMLYINMPFQAKETLFREAARGGNSMIRVDVALSGIWGLEESWKDFDEIALLSRRYGIRVLGVLTATPWFNYACPPGTPDDLSYRCPPKSYELWAGMVTKVVEHGSPTIRHWEVLNEPDGFFYHGTAAEYAKQLSFTYDAVKQADPHAKVAFGGIVGDRLDWFEQVMTDPQFPAASKFDIANVHIRGSLRNVAAGARLWKQRFAAHGFTGPLWVTEHGYPSLPAHQTWDRGFTHGERDQARYLHRSVPALKANGVAKVFVTGRDNLDGVWASEGVFSGVKDPVRGIVAAERKPAFFTLARDARRASRSVGRNKLRVRRHDGTLAGRLTGDLGCRVDRKVFLLDRNRRARATVRTDDRGRFQAPAFKVREAVIRADGACRRVASRVH